MARLQAVRREQVEGADVDPRSGTGGVVALLLFVVAVAALGEVVAGRAPASPRPSSWEAVLRIGDDARARGDAGAARRAYLTTLFRARGERSLLGVLSAAEGFHALGDREVVEQFKLKKGDEVDVSVHPQTGAIVVRAGVRYIEGGKVTKRFLQVAEKLIRRRAKAYRELAKR